MSGVEIGNAAALASVSPGADVHEPVWVVLPSAEAGATVPVELPVIDPTMVTGAAGGKVKLLLVVIVIVVVGAALDPGMVVVMVPMALGTVGLATTLVFVEVTLITDGDSSTAVGEQFTLVPGIVGSRASGGEANVVAGAPGTVAAEKRLENGLGPVSGDDTIAPGVVAIAMAVVPMVETWARQLPPVNRNATVTQRSVRIQGSRRSSVAARRKQRGRSTQLTIGLY
jgi:hypothetical protein